MKTQLRLLKVLTISLLTSCSYKESEGNDKILFQNFLSYSQSRKNVLYQYYEKFGFTNVCTHSRSLFFYDLTEKNDWKKLPINKRDLEKINSIENKVDTLLGDSFNLYYKYKDFYQDIRVENNEYIKDSTKIESLQMNLDQGYYKFDEQSFQIYDIENRMLYVEYYECN